MATLESENKLTGTLKGGGTLNGTLNGNTGGGGTGADGFSPIITVTETATGHTVTIRDILGTKSFDIDDGADGRGITEIKRTSGNGAAGTKDTYTIYYTNNTTSTFTVYNGANGANGKDGADGYTPVKGKDYFDGKDGANGADGKDGADGVGIQSVKQTTTSTTSGGKNVITVTLTNGTTSTFTVYNGQKGADGTGGGGGGTGEDGVSVSDAEINDSGELVLYLSNGDEINVGRVVGTDGKDGADGANGKDGTNGKDGVGVTSAAVNAQGNLVITLSDGQTKDAGRVRGDGIDSITQTKSPTESGGENEISILTNEGEVYKFTVRNGQRGEDGTNGVDGKNGADGADGVGIKSVVQTTTSSEDGGTNKVTVTLTDGKTSTFQFKNGSKGSQGSQGKSIASVTKKDGTGAAGTYDTYEVKLDDGTAVGTFRVYNGADGAGGGGGTGVDGVSVENAYVGDDGHLIIELSTGELIDAGYVVGEDGVSGVYVGSGEMPEGYNVQINPDGESDDLIDTLLESLPTETWTFTMADGSVVTKEVVIL